MIAKSIIQAIIQTSDLLSERMISQSND